MKHSVEQLLLAERVMRFCADLRESEGTKEWRPLYDAGKMEMPRDVWIAREFSPRHPLTEYVPEAMRRLQLIADAITQQPG